MLEAACMPTVTYVRPAVMLRMEGASGRVSGGDTVVVVVALLLPGAGSAEVAVTVAVLEITVVGEVAGATATTRVKTELPSAADALLHNTVPAAPTAGVVQDQPVATDRETKLVWAGKVSLQLALAAALGPLLSTVTE